MKTRIAVVALGLLLFAGFCGTAEAAANLEKVAIIVMVGLPFSFLVVGIFVHLMMKERYQKDVYVAAIEKGMPVPEKPDSDYRKPALVLCAVGAGYGIAVATVFVAANRWDFAVGAGAWGVIPIFLGVALWKYGQLAARDRERLSNN